MALDIGAMPAGAGSDGAASCGVATEDEMDQLMPRKPQDVDRWSDQAERDPLSDPAAGPQDRWVNESYRGDLDEPGADAGAGGTDALNRALEDDGDITGSPSDPTIHGQAR